MKAARFVSITLMIGLIVMNAHAVISDFEDLTLPPDSAWSGNYTTDGTGGTYDTSYFNSGSAVFENHSDGDWGVWGGFAYSNKIDIATAGFMNQYSVYAGKAHTGSNFGIGYQDDYNGFNPQLVLNNPTLISGAYITNTTYTALDMLNGSPGFSKKFGGETGDDPDWLLLTITGKDQSGAALGTVDFYLADYRFADNSRDYILDRWTYVDLSSLGVVSSVEFTLTSSDMSNYGINTPTYFAIDTIVPEPATLALLGLGALLLRRKSA